MGHSRPKFCVRYAKKYTGLKKYTTTSSALVAIGAKTNVLFYQNKTNQSFTLYHEKKSPI